MGNSWRMMMLLLCGFLIICHANSDGTKKRVIKVNGGPESVVWVVQLSDLHFSVHHRDRALNFSRLIGPALSLLNPSLVLITGDLTDGKSRDLLTMKQNEEEWLEYQHVMEEVVQTSGLDKSIFYDLRGNHDNFGVPSVGDPLDFFSKYSINGELGRTSDVNSVTVETSERKHLFVGLDSTLPVGVRGPTNLFGHPSDQLLAELDSQLSQWDDSSPGKPVTKISFGHFPLSFSAFSSSGKSLKDIFLKHSISAYLCGHLHTRFGKNLKRHHQSVHRPLLSQWFFQLNIKIPSTELPNNCSYGAPEVEEFWEWEMGDWRKSRAMRVLAIDQGHVSYVDMDYKSGPKATILVPTFPVDSRFMSTSLSRHKYECQNMVSSSYETVRALVFSTSPIISVKVKIYDSSGSDFSLVMESYMTKHQDNSSRADLYSAPWNYKAFEDPSPDRYWLQIEATDMMNRISFTELRPFSVSGLNAQRSWTWREFFVMGCQWAALYGPIFWSVVCSMFSILIIPKLLLIYLNKQFTYRSFITDKEFLSGIVWVFQELCRIPILWFGLLGYLFSLILFPWFTGQVFTTDGRGYMTYKGWVVQSVDISKSQKNGFIAHPDIMVIVIPHLAFVVLPSILVASALAAESNFFQEHIQSTLGKKEDDYHQDKKGARVKKTQISKRGIRKLLLVACLLICWKHFMNCRVLVKAYEMNPFLHSPAYSFAIPLLLAYAVHVTGRIS